MLHGTDDLVKLKNGGAWLNGLKGLLCLQVFLGHYYIAFFWEDIFHTPSLFNNFFLFLFTGCVTVPFFCCVSGFLLERKKPAKIYDLQLAIFNRFLRFEIPLAPVFFLIMLFVRKTNVYDFANLLAEGLENKRLLNYFPSEAHFTDLYRIPFYSMSYYIGPLWMMKSLFFGGVLVYCKNFIINLVKQYKPSLVVCSEALIYIFLFVLFRKDFPGLSVIFGSFVSRLLSSQLMSNVKVLRFIRHMVAVLLLFSFVLHVYMYMCCKMFDFALEKKFYIEGLFFCWVAFIFLLFTRVKTCFELKIFQFLGKLSFGIYVLHDFVIGIVSCISIFYLKDLIGYRTSVFIVFLLTILFVLICGYLFSIWEIKSTKYIKNVINFLEEN